MSCCSMTEQKRLPKKRPRTKARIRREDKSRHVRGFLLGEGLETVRKHRRELEEMTDVLLGRLPSPIAAGRLTLMEVADAYFARASEITMKIHAKELDGEVTKGDPLYKFRTGELRVFMEMCKRAADLGSRRLTEDTLRFDMEKYGRESFGD